MLYFVAMWLVVTLPVSLVLGITAAVSHARGPQGGQPLGVPKLWWRGIWFSQGLTGVAARG
jgi:hypothetical protein